MTVQNHPDHPGGEVATSTSVVGRLERHEVRCQHATLTLFEQQKHRPNQRGYLLLLSNQGYEEGVHKKSNLH